MSYETASTSSSRSIPPLPPFLHLTSTQESNDNVRPAGSKNSMKSFGRAFHTIVPIRFSKVDCLERVAEATVEDENAVYGIRHSNSMKRRTLGRSPSSRLSTPATVSQSHHSSKPQHSPKTLNPSFSSLNHSDIPSRSPANKSPFSTVFVGEGEDDGEDDSALALWQTEHLHRARLAKLTRHLGEEIPAELVPSPDVITRGSLRSSVHLRRGYHHKHKSLDHSVSGQESSVNGSAEGALRKTKSLKMPGDIRSPLSMTRITPMIPTVHIASGVRKVETTVLGTTPEAHWDSIATDALNGDTLHKRESMDTHSDSLISCPLHPSVEISSLGFSSVPRRRPLTADASRRVEKLANFFGVNDEDVLAVAEACENAHKFHSSSAGDLAIGIHAPLAQSQVEVEVKVSKPARFWNGRETTQRIHLVEDMRAKLRAIRAP